MVIQIFPPEERGTALGFWGIAAAAAPAVGPTLEGSPQKPFRKFDCLGFIFSTVGIVSILYVLGEGAAIDWETIKNPLLLTVGCFSILLFIINELTHSDPLLELRVLKSFEFTISQAIQCIMFFVLMEGMYVVPLFLQNRYS